MEPETPLDTIRLSPEIELVLMHLPDADVVAVFVVVDGEPIWELGAAGET